MIAAVVGSLVATLGLCAAAATRATARDRVLHRAGVPGRPGPARRWIASIPRRPALAVVFAIPILALSYAIAGPPAAVVVAVAAVTIPRVVRRRRAAKGRAQLESQLATAVSGVAAALRAGLSLSQSIRFAATESEPPVSETLGAVAQREDLGVPLDESLARWGRSASSGDVRLVVDVLRLRIGAGLPRVLDQVCRSLRARQSARRDVRSLTAQARLSGTILGLLPIGFFLFLSITSRHDMAAAYGSPAGVGAIALGLLLQAGAFLWIRKLVDVEV